MPDALNHGYAYRSRIPESARGTTALDFLTQRYPRGSRSTWLARMGRGEVWIEDRLAGPDMPLVPGQRLTWNRPPWREPWVPMDVEVVHEDAHLLVVCKPSGLPMAPAGGVFLTHTLLAWARARDPAWSPLHRLGRGTSGLVVFGRGPALAPLSEAFRDRQVDKRYRALAQGAVPPEPFCVDAPIGPVAHPLLGRVHAASSAGKPAHSRVTALGGSEPDATRVEVHIATGRPHQIRIHLAVAGHPLVGDPLYAPGGHPRPDALPGDLGYTLHAWRLRFAHPITGAPLAFEAPLPPALQDPSR